MWYFAWILGLPLAATFAVLNAMWYELLDSPPPPRGAARLQEPAGRGRS